MESQLYADRVIPGQGEVIRLTVFFQVMLDVPVVQDTGSSNPGCEASPVLTVLKDRNKSA